MANSLDYYIKQSNPAYDSQRRGIQNQINAIGNENSGGTLQNALDALTADYTNRQADLTRQRDYAADTASKSAAARGGAFSGMANLANKDFYDNSFVPAQTQLQTNYNQGRTSTVNDYNDRRMSLEDTLNALTNEQYQYAQSIRQKDLDREAALRAQREAAAIQAKSLADYYNQYRVNPTDQSTGLTNIAMNHTENNALARAGVSSNDPSRLFSGVVKANYKPPTVSEQIAMRNGTYNLNSPRGRELLELLG